MMIGKLKAYRTLPTSCSLKDFWPSCQQECSLRQRRYGQHFLVNVAMTNDTMVGILPGVLICSHKDPHFPFLQPSRWNHLDALWQTCRDWRYFPHPGIDLANFQTSKLPWPRQFLGSDLCTIYQLYLISLCNTFNTFVFLILWVLQDCLVHLHSGHTSISRQPSSIPTRGCWSFESCVQPSRCFQQVFHWTKDVGVKGWSMQHRIYNTG